MATSAASATSDWPFRRWRLAISSLGLALTLVACGGDSEEPPPERVMPAGRLEQTELRGPLRYTSETGWRVDISGGAVVIRPPDEAGSEDLQYVSWRMREQLGMHDLRAWAGGRRTILLPGGAKITMQGQGGEILRMGIYDGDESHEIDVLTQTLLHSLVDAAVAQSRESADADGETGLLTALDSQLSGIANRYDRLHLRNLYFQGASPAGEPLLPVMALRALGRQAGTDLHRHEAPEIPAAMPDQECLHGTTPRGRLVRNEDGSLQYTSRSGLWLVTVLDHQVTVSHASGNAWEVWGDSHESLNGEHIKDWEGGRRTLLLDDGTKVTMYADGPPRVVHATSINDGTESHEIGNVGTEVRHSCINAEVARNRDVEEADGETAFLAHLRSAASAVGYIYVENIYVEAVSPEGVADAVLDVVPLGDTGEADINPLQVTDYYDDPRIDHT